MRTRSGDIAPSMVFYLVQELGYDLREVNTILNKCSGIVGLTGYSDMRDIGKAIDQGNPEAKLAYEMYDYQIRKYIGAYAAVLNGADALVFTDGVGETDSRIREPAGEGLTFMGINLDRENSPFSAHTLFYGGKLLLLARGII